MSNTLDSSENTLPTAKLSAIHFSNTDAQVGQLTGMLNIDPAPRTDIQQYHLLWGADAATPLAGVSEITYFSSDVGTSNNPVYRFNSPMDYEFKQTPVPAGATHLLAMVKRVGVAGTSLYASRPIVDSCHLLPPSATTLERTLAATSGRLTYLPVRLRHLWDPSRCPKSLLPWLAWSLSVDSWLDSSDQALQNRQRRDIIRSNATIHKHKGTVSAIRGVLNSFGMEITVTEWWQENPPGQPHTFKLDMLLNNSLNLGSSDQSFESKLRQAVDDVKPVRSHYTYTISMVQTAPVQLAALSQAAQYKRFSMAVSV